MKVNQHLYLVFGGFLKEIGKEDFSDIKSLEYVGIYDSFTKAKKAWKSKSIKDIDYANKKFKVIPLFNLIDPSENMSDYIKKLKIKNITLDTLSFTPEDTLEEVCKKFKQYKAGAAVIIKKNKLCGIVTERDIVNTVANYKNNALEKQLKLFMTKKVIYININFKLINALEVLKLSGFRHLPIYDDEKFKFYGIISYKDFMIGNLN